MVATVMQRIPVYLASILIIFFIFLIAFLAFGFPLHDFNLWRLERRYAVLSQFHPSDTELVKHEKYLGGPSTHGSSQCIYAVGEIRRTKLSKADIQEAYRNVPDFGTNQLPAKFEIYFSDLKGMPLATPLGDWLYDLEDSAKAVSSSELSYLIYVAQENVPFLGDMRCDD